MELFFSPMACSAASRIAFYEAGQQPTFTAVNLRTKKTADGTDFLAVNPMGQVPTLRTDDGKVVTENPAVLFCIAENYPEADLLPAGQASRLDVLRWLNFVGTELHKGIFAPMFDPTAPAEVKAYALAKLDQRLATLDKHLEGREFLLDRFTIADAYLTTVLNWAGACKIDLGRWPAVKAYHDRMLARPAVARAIKEEMALYGKAA